MIRSKMAWTGLLLLISSHAGAKLPSTGHETGNGGGGVVCLEAGSNLPASIELLDYFEARTMRSISLDLGPSGLDHKEKIELALSRLQRLDPARAERYRRQVSEFFEKEARFLPGIELVPVQDTGPLFLPKECSVFQLAVQRSPVAPGDPRYFISQDLWDRMNENNRAGLVLHEIVYREAIEWGAQNSIRSRYFNSIITSDRMATLSFKDYLDIFQATELEEILIDGIPFEASSLVFFHGSDRLGRGVTSRSVNLSTQGLRFHPRAEVVFSEMTGKVEIIHSRTADIQLVTEKLFLSSISRVEFHSDGKIQALFGRMDEECQMSRRGLSDSGCPTEAEFDGAPVTLDSVFSAEGDLLIRFDENGTLRELNVSSESGFSISVQGQSLIANRQLRFWEDGSPRRFTLGALQGNGRPSSVMTFLDLVNNKVTVHAGQTVELDRQGLVRSVVQAP